ncbi:CU044_5270 family protein [Streptomyces sp. ITFR-6]|uniref:CU044_5270 family protein n=1 Tax=Streptomyces sp. ITFR-6 TaxID=3075197 RepID=UPI00288B3AED|nr:CU044_5270 family protein [Streptomyces sp. ITFR-6]WNI29658.1 CU044_5270 family protein [Streptomyces sp. ITFR-6]
MSDRGIDELRALREYDAEAPPLDNATRNRARARLFAAMSTTSATDRSAARTGRRPVLRIALTGGVAAAVAAGVLIAMPDHDKGDGARAARPGTSSPVMRNVSARTVLNDAAAYERKHEKAVSPRDDQFVYTKEIIQETNQETGAEKSYVDEDWRSVDGSQRSWVMEIGHGWWAPPLQKDETMWPPQDWGTLRKLPTDPEKLILSLLQKTGPDDRNDSLDDITEEEWSDIHFSLAGLLKLVPVMPEGLRPAAYEALGMVPGVRAVPNQKDAKGRTGVAITYDDPMIPSGKGGYGGFFIFEPRTHRFLGFRDERTSGDGANLKRYVQLSYLDGWAVVDKVKQRP